MVNGIAHAQRMSLVAELADERRMLGRAVVNFAAVRADVQRIGRAEFGFRLPEGDLAGIVDREINAVQIDLLGEDRKAVRVRQLGHLHAIDRNNRRRAIHALKAQRIERAVDGQRRLQQRKSAPQAGIARVVVIAARSKGVEYLGSVSRSNQDIAFAAGIVKADQQRAILQGNRSGDAFRQAGTAQQPDQRNSCRNPFLHNKHLHKIGDAHRCAPFPIGSIL